MAKKTTAPSKVVQGPIDLGEIPHTRSPQFRNFYSNNVRISFTPLEFRMTFVNFTEGVGQGKYVLEEEATVTMGLMQFKAFAKGIMDGIEIFEKQHGVIALPPAVLENKNTDGKG
ncbi:MAG: DUF3467 domain-containing protein [Gammaproteobacteria bacterium]